MKNGLHPKVYQTLSSNAKEKVRSVVWTCEMDNCLTKVLAEQVKKGNKVDNILKPAAFAAALKAMNDKFGMCLTKEHIKNRLKTLRKQFRILKEILIQRGFVWNETQKMVVADNSVWNEYIKAHPDARTFQAKCIENYDELCIIIGNVQAVASFSDNVTEIEANFAVDKGDLDLTIVSEVQTEGNQSKILRWTEEMDCWLGKILVDQVRKGLKVDKVLQTEAYQTTVSALNAKFGLQVTKYNIKNRLKTWKKQYELLREILSHAGFKWDETRKMVTADDSTWNDYIRINPDARVLKGRVIRNLNELCIIIGHSDPADSSRICAHANMGLIIDDNIMAAQETRDHGTDNTKDKGKCVTWTDEMDHCLTEQLVKEVMLGNKLEKNFKTTAYIAALTVLNERFCLSLTIENIKTRLKTLKKHHVLVKEMISSGRFLFDEGGKMVVGKDSEWKEYIEHRTTIRLMITTRTNLATCWRRCLLENNMVSNKVCQLLNSLYRKLVGSLPNHHKAKYLFCCPRNQQKHPEAGHLQARRIENYHELDIIFGNEQVSGKSSKIDVNLAPNYEVNAATPALIFSNEEMRHYDASDEAQNSSEQTRPRPSSSLSKQQRRRTSDVMVEMMSVMAADICRIADALTDSNNKTAWLEEVVEKVQNIPDFDDDLIIEACEYLCFNEKRALMFLKLDERLRIKWLLKRLRC